MCRRREETGQAESMTFVMRALRLQQALLHQEQFGHLGNCGIEIDWPEHFGYRNAKVY